jgi:hypothetical protein
MEELLTVSEVEDSLSKIEDILNYVNEGIVIDSSVKQFDDIEQDASRILYSIEIDANALAVSLENVEENWFEDSDIELDDYDIFSLELLDQMLLEYVDEEWGDNKTGYGIEIRSIENDDELANNVVIDIFVVPNTYQDMIAIDYEKTVVEKSKKALDLMDYHNGAEAVNRVSEPYLDDEDILESLYDRIDDNLRGYVADVYRTGKELDDPTETKKENVEFILPRLQNMTDKEIEKLNEETNYNLI